MQRGGGVAMVFIALLLMCSVELGTAGSANCTCPGTGVAQPALTREEDTIRSIQCTLRCVQKVSTFVANWSLYSSLRLRQLDCSINQKLSECKRGCLLSDSFQNSNDCRDQCYEACQSECSGATSCSVQGLSCEQQCKKPPCKQGCEEFNWTASLDPSLAPLSPPDVRSNGTECGLYSVNITGALPIPSADMTGEVVGIAINTTGCGKNALYWQRTPGDIVDMRPFLCATASVSFALVTRYNRSKWSPTSQLCSQAVTIPIHLLRTVYPSQVPATSIKIRYYEDPRPTFIGYAALIITWTKPTGSESLTSYTIQLLSQQSECGGSNVLYSYNNINKDLTEFTIQARISNGLLKFRCNYYLIFTVYPIASGRSGTYIQTTPQLSGPPPQMAVVCQKAWSLAFFNISVSLAILNSTKSVLESIAGFTITSDLIQARNSNFVPLVVERYGYVNLQTQMSSDNYSLQLDGFKPKAGLELFYRVQIQAVQNNVYFWRLMPGPQTCYVESGGLPPAPIYTLRVNTMQYTSARTQAIFSWNPPAATNGALVAYELCVTTNVSAIPSQQSNACVLTVKTAVNQTSPTVIGSVESAAEPLCLYAQVRSFNEYLASDWSRRTLISNNPRCGWGSGLQAASGAETLMYAATILIY